MSEEQSTIWQNIAKSREARVNTTSNETNVDNPPPSSDAVIEVCLLEDKVIIAYKDGLIPSGVLIYPSLAASSTSIFASWLESIKAFFNHGEKSKSTSKENDTIKYFDKKAEDKK